MATRVTRMTKAVGRRIVPMFRGCGARSGASSDASSDATITTNFLARTSGLDATHIAAYKALINGLVTDGICTNTTWGVLDGLWVASQDSVTSLLNLPSATYNLTANGAPTFVADRGFTGGAGKDLDSGFNPTTATSPHFTRNSACAFAWSLKSGQDTGALLGFNLESTALLEIFPRFTDDKAYTAINSGAEPTTVSMDGSGLWAVDRSDSGNYAIYREGSAIDAKAVISVPPQNSDIFFLRVGSGNFGGQVAAGGYGAHMTATSHANLRTRLFNYLHTLGAV